MATIVSCYFKLNKSKVSHEKYLQWMQNMLIIDNPMIIFCDLSSSHIIHSFRKDKMDITRIIITEFTDFYSYRYFKNFNIQQNMDKEINIGHNTYLYMVWSEKSNFLKRAIELDPFNTEYFLWVDIGCFRIPNKDFIKWPNINNVPNDKVLLLSVYSFTNDELNVKTYDDIPNFQFTNRIGASIFGGGKKILLEWHTKYYDMIELFILTGKFIGKDQSIMNYVYLLNQDMCRLIEWKQPCNDIWFYLQNYLQYK